jgi:hypothetical protein
MKMILEVLRIITWPITVLIAVFALRSYLAPLLSGSKVKISLFGQSVETTLPELESVVSEQAGGALSELQMNYLKQFYQQGAIDYPNGVESDEKEALRPLRNYGLIMTIPRGKPMRKAKSLQISALGRLVMKSKYRGN